mgnify:CR=1 FL=1
MKTTIINTDVLKSLHYLNSSIVNSKTFNIQRSRLIFKPDKNTPVYKSNFKDMYFDHEKHYHRQNTLPVVEKQTLIQEKKKQKKS